MDEKIEVWKDIPEIKNYLVSNLGSVKRLGEKSDKILRPCKSTQGYLVVRINGKTLTVHRLVAFAFYPTSQFYGLDVNHKDGNKGNNHKDNLEWCTRKHNINHAFELGLNKKKCKYPNSIVEHVCHLYTDKKLSTAEIKSNHYPEIPVTTISNFVHGYVRKSRLSKDEKEKWEEQLKMQKLEYKARRKTLRGENNPSTHLTSIQVMEIRQTYKTRNSTRKEFANKFGLTESGLKGILSGRNWKYVTQPLITQR